MKKSFVLPKIPNPPRCSFGSVTIGTKTYIIGGHINETHHYASDNFTDMVDMYDSATNSWTSLAPRPRASQGFFAAAYGNYIYAFGGLVHNPNYSNPEESYISIPYIDRYDITTNTWTTIGYLPNARSSYFGGVVDGIVYLIGGWYGDANYGPVGGKFLSSVDAFNLSTEQAYTTGYTMPGSLRRAGGAISNGNEIIIAGGITNTVDIYSMCLSSVLYFIPGLGSPWYWGYSLPVGTFAPGLGLDDQLNLYSFGGYQVGVQSPTPPPSNFIDTVYFLPRNGSSGWSVINPMQQNKGFVDIVNLGSSTFGLLGGALDPAESGGQSDAFNLYNGVSKNLSKTPLFKIPKH